MPRYAPFDPNGPRPAVRRAVRIRVARPTDAAEIVAVAATRGDQPAGHLDRVARWIADETRLVLVAVVPDARADGDASNLGGVVGWGMVSRWAPDDAPHGHVVSALTVHPRWWRRGVGMGLLTALQRWTWERADQLWSIVNVRNETSLALHVGHGFVEVRRAARLGGVAFDGGEGVLLCATREASPTTDQETEEWIV